MNINIKLKDLVVNIFTEDQINKIPKFLQNKNFSLKKVNDISSFISSCIDESKDFKIAGEHRIDDWENGWSGNGVYYSEDDEINNLPYYFKNNTHIRVGNEVYEDLSGFSEVFLLRSLQSVIFETYLKEFNANSIIEYGCGTGSNISFLEKLYNKYNFYGTDWASSACKKLIENKIVSKSNAIKVDYFDKETFFAPKEDNVIFTNASLEQSGEKYIDFMNYLFTSDSVAGGIHIEPIRDLLELDTDLNIQSFNYAQKRGYLTNFYSFMKNTNNIKLLLAKDFGIGSKYISGYQVIVWKKN